MANKILTSTKIVRECLRVLHNSCVFLRNVNRQYNDQFKMEGAKVGNYINVKKPNRYYVSRQTALQVQDTQNVMVPVRLQYPYQVGLQFSQADLSLSIDDFSKNIITPAMSAMASAIDLDGLAMLKLLYNQVGGPGHYVGESAGLGFAMSNMPNIATNAGAVLTWNCAPRDKNRRMLLNPTNMASAANAGVTWFNDQKALGDVYREGVVGRAHGFEWAEDQNINWLTNGTHGGTPVVYGANQSGASLLTSGWTASTTPLKAGEVFNIAGVYMVNPDNQQTTGILQGFVALSDVVADANGYATISISPSIKVIGDKIADGTVTALPANGAALTLLSGSASTAYPIQAAYHGDAFTFATADLEMPQGVDFAARETYEGVSMLIVRDYDINTGNFPCRIDVLAAWEALRAEFGVRVAGN